MLAHTYYLRDPRVRREAEALAEAGIEVHVVALSEPAGSGNTLEPRRSVVRGVHVHRLPLTRKRGNALRYLFEYVATGVLGGLKLTMLHVRRRIDVVHVHNMPDLLVLAALVPWLSGSKVVLDVHDPMPELFSSWNRSASRKWMITLLRIQERISLRFADYVFSVNESMRDNLRGKGVPDSKIFIIHNFPDQQVFPICDAPPSRRNPNDLVLLYCGTVTEHYDLGLAVRAIARLAGSVPIRLRIVGEGNRLEAVLQLASTLGVRDCVEHVGSIPVDRVAAEMRKADFGISCHRAGPFGDLQFPTKIIECLTQGLAVLTPRTDTIAKYLPDDGMFYFEGGNEASLAECLTYVWQNPGEVSRRLGLMKELLPRLSWQAEKENFIRFYKQLITRRGMAPVIRTAGEAAAENLRADR